MMAHRRLTEHIPEHLRPYIAHQDASLYTAIDHASWRFILRISKAYFARHAHPKYLAGLEETGISTERIPLIGEMDRKLRRFGWRAVPVSGFIPPAVFMEFQSLGILPIACEMRTLDHLAYTPAPDIVHEAAGHAPIIVDPEYAAYLRAYGEVSRKAIFSSQDQALYEAVRELSDTKENPKSTPEDIMRAERRLSEANDQVTYASEANLLARMNWWTVEYGLVGDLSDPKIYGAGLLSSVGESYHCLGPEVRKIPFGLGCIEFGYDITRPQPQLFVTPDFQRLAQALEEFAATMAFRQGGSIGLDKARQAQTTITVELDSGIQLSGILEGYLKDAAGDPGFLRFKGPTQLAYKDSELPGQGPQHHREGYSTPLGPVRLADGLMNPADLTPQQLEQLGFAPGRKGRLEFASGVVAEGILKGQERRSDRSLLLLTLDSCTVTLGGQVLFRPEWGVYDLACGNRVVSVFGGAADRGAYIRATGGFRQAPRIPKTNLTASQRDLNVLYQRVRDLREAGAATAEARAALDEIHCRLERSHRDDWLLRLELLELNALWKLKAQWEAAVRERLREISGTRQDRAEMIARGLDVLDEREVT